MKQMDAEKKRYRVKTKKMLEERWELIRCISDYIDYNKENWEK